jgi:hypothetical protein
MEKVLKMKPVALAHRSESGKSLIVRCPFCGREHLHGAFRPGLGASDGPREAHCRDDVPGRDLGYIVVEIPFAMQ